MHEIVRIEILDQIQSHIVSRSPSVCHFLNLLEMIIKENPDSLNDYMQRVSKNIFLILIPLLNKYIYIYIK